MALDASDHLMASDPRTGIVAFYDLHASTPRLTSRATAPGAISDLCFLGAVPVLYSPMGAGRLFKIASGGRWEAIARTVGVERPRIQEALNDSRILCLPEQRQILVVGVFVPSIRLFDENGKLVWSTELKDFHGVRVVIDNPRSITYLSVPGGYQRVIRVVNLSSDLAAIQLATVGQANPDWFNPGPIETRIIDTKTGREVGRLVDAREILHVRDGNALLVDYRTRTITRNELMLQGSAR